MVVGYKKVYTKLYYKVLNGRCTENDRRKLYILFNWLMMEDKINEG